MMVNWTKVLLFAVATVPVVTTLILAGVLAATGCVWWWVFLLAMIFIAVFTLAMLEHKSVK